MAEITVSVYLLCYCNITAQIQLIVCDKNSRLKSLLSHCDQTPSVHTIVYIEEPTTELWQLARKRNIELLSWSKMEVILAMVQDGGNDSLGSRRRY